MKTIVKQLTVARDCIKTADKTTLAEIVAGCVKTLQQSPRDYSPWAARHKDAIRKYHRASIVALIDLTISDVQATPYDYPSVWQFEQFGANRIAARAAKKSKECTCQTCRKKFWPARRAKFCSPACGNRARYRAGKIHVLTG